MKDSNFKKQIILLSIIVLSSITTNTRAQEAYVEMSQDLTTLTFYYDTQKANRKGTVYQLNKGYAIPKWHNGRFADNDTCNTIIIDKSFKSARPTSCYGWFAGFKKVKEILGIENLNTSEVTNMKGMFYACNSITNLNLSNFNTTNVTDMIEMFSEMINITSLDLSSFDTKNVNGMMGIFRNCFRLKYIFVDKNKWQLSENIINKSQDMFLNCLYLFGEKGTECTPDKNQGKYARIDEGQQKPGLLTEKGNAPFTPQYKNGIPYVILNNGVLYFKFGKTIESGGNTIHKWPLSYQTLLGDTVRKVVFDKSFAKYKPKSTSYWFSECSELKTIEGLEYLNTSEVTDMSGMFHFCCELINLDLSNFNTDNVTDMAAMFFHCRKLDNLDLSHFNTAKVTNMCAMFAGCDCFKNVYFSNFNTANVTTLSSMFSSCTNLETVDLSNFNTDKVTDMHDMFFLCTNLISVNLSNFNTKNVTNLHGMFCNCYNLKTIDFKMLDTHNVTDMSHIFYQCQNLEYINVSGFDTKSVNYMNQMFDGCTKLTSLDLSNFKTDEVKDMSRMFGNCSNLKTIYINSDWNYDNIRYSDNMFKNCTNLVGGKGTKYDPEHIDLDYARIDEGESAPGYFTKK